MSRVRLGVCGSVCVYTVLEHFWNSSIFIFNFAKSNDFSWGVIAVHRLQDRAYTGGELNSDFILIYPFVASSLCSNDMYHVFPEG